MRADEVADERREGGIQAGRRQLAAPARHVAALEPEGIAKLTCQLVAYRGAQPLREENPGGSRRGA